MRKSAAREGIAASMEPHLVEHLLYQEASPFLVFRERAFPFHGVRDEEKAALLLEIMGLANAWRPAAAHLLVGVRKVRGGRAIPVGTDPDFPWQRLPKFFARLCNRAPEFEATRLEIEGVACDVVRVPIQRRPVYLTQDFGGLHRQVVYVHRGKEITEATPDEIAAMGYTTMRAVESKPTLEVEFADVEHERALGWQLGLVSEVCPQLREAETRLQRGDLRALPGLVAEGDSSLVRAQHVAIVQDLWQQRVLNHVGFVVRGKGGASVQGARLELAFQDSPSLLVMDERSIPHAPRLEDEFGILLRPVDMQPSVRVNRHQGWVTVTADLGNISPRTTRWVRDCLIIGAVEDTRLEIRGQVTADNLDEPIPIEGLIEIFSQQSDRPLRELIAEVKGEG